MCQSSIQFSLSRLNNLIEATNGQIVFEKESRDPKELYFPPIVVEIEANDILMQEEVHLRKPSTNKQDLDFWTNPSRIDIRKYR